VAPIIQVEEISKKYSKKANSHLSYGVTDLFREVFARSKTLVLRKDEFLAVDHVSFALEPGDTFALIGRNGSGKTTVLKMMNGLVKPDAGRIIMDGRIQALINLGAGFNFALSGLDNIYNSASLMGLKSREIGAIVDEIVDFAELSEFIESQVGTYSSGMKARLGFAVAVSLKPDILLIDEVLSVGDSAFQNKCFMRMEELKKAGVTIVFVSHAHASVVKLCKQAAWMHHGKIMAAGPSLATVQAYLAFLEKEEQRKLEDAAAKAARKPAAPPTPEPPTDAKPQETPAPGKKADAASEKKPEPKPAAAPVQTSKPEPKPDSGPKRQLLSDTDIKALDAETFAKDGLYGPVHQGTEHVDQIECHLFVGGREVNIVPVHSELVVQSSFRLKREVNGLCSTLNFHRKDGLRVAEIATMTDGRLEHIHHGHVFCEVRIPDFDFVPGHYVIMMPIAEGQSHLWRDVVKEFYVDGGGKLYFGIKEITHTYKVWVE